MRYLVLLVLIVSCSDPTGAGPYRYPEIRVSVSWSPRGSSQCAVNFLATATNHDDVVTYELYAPGTPGTPTSFASGRTPLGVEVVVDQRDFYLDWSVSGPGYQYTAPNPHVVTC